MRYFLIFMLAFSFLYSADSSAKRVSLRLAHNLSADHPTSEALKYFANAVAEKTNKQVRVRLFLNGVLGNEREVLEQVQNGIIDMTRVGASSLENFSTVFTAFTLPYLFDSQEHFYHVMKGDVGEEIYRSALDQGFYGLTFFDGGVRSFYTVGKPINTPDDLRGQKIRVMNSHTAIRMIELMGGTPTPLPYGEIPHSNAAEVIDGAENNPTALTIGRHGEVAKYYSFDEHAMIPDFLIIGVKSWEKLSDSHKKALKEAALEATDFHIELWNQTVNDSIEEAKGRLNIHFSYPDKALFRAKVTPLYDEYRVDPKIDAIISSIAAQSLK